MSLFRDEPIVAAAILDPDAVRVARVARSEFEDGVGRFLFTFETTMDGEEVEFRVGMLPEEAVVLVTGVLEGLGFPESDVQYLRNRWRSEFA